ncbi:heme-degrading domain-containing protein [Propionicimonas sp.]|uniref:heme-degrading domain-containing protein n=1 Tax=Propionicimonas sp. TaxID=1955623 RepID=UPI0017C1DD2E|nr:heme-degrading domain-containing protein [Propionicimonas sp.]MBU3977546.1 heme-degrading domain-containing protein [Actinomycetota bacterium]MBA3021471.1 heme-degrading domain-containing protein [Propionicimonas sp.]MBU3987020.1 heme-degrading domain-containing protein [Actinomycetota bacterium]MBU4008841.1 heme-degrading domain-containing protein [Actinomycetota bacterium]MBU4066009.1 heme-degrading domain-containing protein [Actinomycetota bacterium]
MSKLSEQLAAEAAQLRFADFSLSDAWQLGVQMQAAAVAESLPIVIGIRIGEQRVFHAALPGSSADNDDWLERKTAVALRYGEASLAVGEKFRDKGKDFDTDSRRDPARYAAHGGVVPICLLSGTVIGAVGVSGLPQHDDHAFVVRMLREFLGAEPEAEVAPKLPGRRFLV